MFCDPNPGIARWDLRYHRVHPVHVVVSDTFWSLWRWRGTMCPNPRSNTPRIRCLHMSKLFLDLDISKGYQGGNSLNPWNSSRENCQSFKDRNDCKIVSNIKQFLFPASMEEQYLHRRWCWRCWGVSQSWEMVGLETNHSYFMMRKLCKGRTDKNTWATLAMSISFVFFFVRWHCQDVCVTHTKAGTKRRWPTCTSRCWTLVFVHLLNDDKASRSLLDSCITIINDCTWLSLHHVAKSLFRQSNRWYHFSSAARSGFALGFVLGIVIACKDLTCK